jgi:hypothetical protein
MTRFTTIGGSWGELTVDAETGQVLTYDHNGTLPDPEDASERGYTLISRVDLDEWRKTYGDQEPTAIDILDVGYWYGPANLYEPPAQDWRDDYEMGGNR